MSRLEQLLPMLESDPNDTFIRYAIAMEYMKLQQHAEALAAFEELLKRDPNYVAAYFMAGRTCEQSENIPAAKTWYTRGIATAQKVGDSHAAGEMSSALMMIE